MHLETTLTQLREMRLSVMADALHQRLEYGDQHGLSGEEFAALLIEDEYCARQQRSWPGSSAPPTSSRKARAWRMSAMPPRAGWRSVT